MSKSYFLYETRLYHPILSIGFAGWGIMLYYLDFYPFYDSMTASNEIYHETAKVFGLRLTEGQLIGFLVWVFILSNYINVESFYPEKICIYTKKISKKLKFLIILEIWVRLLLFLCVSYPVFIVEYIRNIETIVIVSVFCLLFYVFFRYIVLRKVLGIDKKPYLYHVKWFLMMFSIVILLVLFRNHVVIVEYIYSGVALITNIVSENNVSTVDSRCKGAIGLTLSVLELVILIALTFIQVRKIWPYLMNVLLSLFRLPPMTQHEIS